jgi:hypothetical protein
MIPFFEPLSFDYFILVKITLGGSPLVIFFIKHLSTLTAGARKYQGLSHSIERLPPCVSYPKMQWSRACAIHAPLYSRFPIDSQANTQPKIKENCWPSLRRRVKGLRLRLR